MLIESYAGVFQQWMRQATLAKGFDSLDAFYITHSRRDHHRRAPKKWAAQAIENLEKEARGWYGGAVGMISMDGDINTGITIRTIHLRDGVAAYGAGALCSTIRSPADQECALKATGFFRALNAEKKPASICTPD